MSEAADELERMAEELNDAAKSKAKAVKQFDDQALVALINSETAGLLFAVDKLRGRAAAIRAAAQKL